MQQIQKLILNYLNIWATSAIEKKSGPGHFNSNNEKIYGIEKLRQLILDLAISGRLMPENDSNNPAVNILKDIEIENNKLTKKGLLTKRKPLTPVNEDEKIFALPKNWEWIKIGNTGKVFNGNSINENEKKTKYTNIKDGRPFIATKDVGYGREKLNYKNGVSIPYDETKFKVAHKNAVLICSEGGSAGRKIGITELDVCFGNKLLANETFSFINPRFIFYIYQSQSFYRLFSKRMNGIIGGISISDFLNIPIPVPPINQQNKIVIKIDELMALCDQLEKKHVNSQIIHEKLVKALLDILIQAKNLEEFKDSWKRIASHFNSLFTTKESLDNLKQTLLQVAITGKLVSQDTNDEDVSNLLIRIKNHQSLRVTNKEIQKPRTIITKSDPKLSIPKSWVYKPLGEIAFVTKLAGFEYTKYINLKDSGDVPVIRAQNVKPFFPQLNNLKYIDLETSKKLYRSALNKPCLLITFIGTIGDACIFNKNERWHLAPNVAKAEPFANINLDYLNFFLNSPNGREEISKYMKSTAQASLTMEAIREIWVPIPPIEEQQRIVKKLEELMTLCDELKYRTQQANVKQKQIADVLISQALH